MGPVVLLTDFGADGHYAGIMKGVVRSLAPDADIMDLSHSVAPQDVRGAAFILMTGAAFFPPGSVFACVVDPGVGSERAVLCARGGGRLYLAPDNGLLSWLGRVQPFDSLRRVENDSLFLKPLSSTFHGRDIFAPVAARLASGMPDEDVGPAAEGMAEIPFPSFREGDESGEIIFRDCYGNCVTNVPCGLAGGKRFFYGEVPLGPAVESYSRAGEGLPAAVLGSGGFVEFSVNGGSFGRKYGAQAGSAFTIKY